MVSLTFGLFTQVSGSGPLGPLVFFKSRPCLEESRLPENQSGSNNSFS